MSQRIAFLGIGLMGAPMAERLIAAGHSVTLWNRTAAKAAVIAAAGARVAASPAAAAGEADVLIAMLENGPAVEAVLFGDAALGYGGAAAALKPGTLAIDMSSSPPPLARDHAQRFAARGIGYLDAPVSGGVVGARAGSLAIMAGGSAQDFARAQPIFDCLGRANRVGPAGSGQLAKCCNQAIVAITIGAVAEALLLAAASGADPAAVREALIGGFADSRILALHGKRMIERDFLPGGRASVQLKDQDTILAAAKDAGLHLPLSECVTSLYRDLVALGGGELDQNALLLELERRNAPARLGAAVDKIPSN
ncbi:MAG TPA: NAD(P)-dependent oxidoreductase [Stellaceae bacterium]|nr:NAD(P)-dependent oxidoreductase [Stellaceae bacterium]